MPIKSFKTTYFLEILFISFSNFSLLSCLTPCKTNDAVTLQDVDIDETGAEAVGASAVMVNTFSGSLGTVSATVKNITFDGTTYNGSIKSELTLDQTDIIAYWRILDNWINVDIGFNIKTINGNIKLEATGSTTTDKDFSATIPMLYAKGRFDLPFTGLSAEADISYISYSGNKFTDFKAGVVYQTSFGLGATAGVRTENLKIDDIDDFSSDLTISGAYIGAFYHF